MKENEKKERRGGRREGAGRPHSNSKLYTFRASGKMANFIDTQDNKTAFIKNRLTLGGMLKVRRCSPSYLMPISLIDVKSTLLSVNLVDLIFSS